MAVAGLEDRETDVLVVGSGAGGLTAAVAASALGLDVLVVEKAPVLGGTTALSEGMIWIPNNAQERARGIADSAEAALDYIARAAGNAFERERAARYIEAALEMLDFMTEHSEARFILAAGSCDYHPDLPGASTGGRALDPTPYDGRRLGADFSRLRRPLATTQIFGGMSISGTELGHYFKVFRSAASTALVARRLARYGWDRLCGRPRGTLIGNGNALVGRLLASLKARDVPVWESAPVRRLLIERGRITGAEIEAGGRSVAIRARRGVILACGGFTASDEMKRRHYPHVRDGKNHTRLAPETNTGDGAHLAEAAGGRLNTSLAQPAAWAPVSLVPQKNGDTVPYPHFIDRNKPGFVIVDRHGRRFVNESNSYHLIVQAMVEACRPDETVEAWIVADRPAIRRYGIGVVPPWPGRTGPHLRNGYLKVGATLEGLARSCGIDPAGLADTLARFNANATEGKDPEYLRGRNAYNLANGDPNHRPNPALGPIATPPFHAVRIVPGDLGTFYGLDTTPDAQVLNGAGEAIPGLYAVGNDMASVMGGAYIGAGITIGAAMTFGYVAARHLTAQEPQEKT
ncbi:MAG: FAD-dependent oxidoreductase [Rhodospirillaceae bacterium]|nr:FAD-dependent oxidoreductase [Rhodospirillaceae bacterium]